MFLAAKANPMEVPIRPAPTIRTERTITGLYLGAGLLPRVDRYEKSLHDS